MSLERFDTPTVIDDLTVAFGPRSIDELLPSYRDLPEEFQRERHEGCRIAQGWFFEGLKRDLTPRQGIDKPTALRHLKACLGSFEPKHEHKIAGCGYLLAKWFEIGAPSDHAAREAGNGR